MLDADAIINNLSQKVGGSIMPIWTQLLKKWVGLDPEKHIGSAPLLMVAEKNDVIQECHCPVGIS